MLYRLTITVAVVVLTLNGSGMAQQLSELPPHLQQAVVQEKKTIIYKGSSPSDSALPAILLAAMQQPDFLELPVVLTRDNAPLVFDDIHLHPKTNVAEVFPERSREDGNYYTIDFSLAEITRLVYTDQESELPITSHPVSLDDVLTILPQVREFTGASLKILPVVKFPWFHSEEIFDISNSILKTLTAHADSADTRYYLKCYDPDELQRIEELLLPGLPLQVQLIQGIDHEEGRETMRKRRGRWQDYNYDWMFTRLGLRVLSGYAHGLALRNPERMTRQKLQTYISDIQGLEMKIFIEVPAMETAVEQEYFNEMLLELNADGLALSQPRKVRQFLNDQAPPEPALFPEELGTEQLFPHARPEHLPQTGVAPEPQQDPETGFDPPPGLISEPEDKPSPPLSDPESLSERLRQLKGEE
ncbi:MAG: hypothetical protein GVY02_00935 [Bacteroidetes bacterium]|jgi:glycerophosphoryl diester phosphodiesterase|nr:hypothetical protein [Bacteroidota bacterium]